MLAAKGLYKLLSKVDLSPVVAVLLLACRWRDTDLLGQVLLVVHLIVQRYGFVELKKSSKVENQLLREAAAKEAFFRVQGCDGCDNLLHNCCGFC